jgi:ubiquinone/menaquinone biosynthesis C-methylase UbiE
MRTEDLQKEHYDKIADSYTAHYSDKWSKRYRDEFIHEPMFRHISLEGKKVLDTMCGAGELSEFLRQKTSSVVGVDISKKMIEQYRTKWSDAQVYCRSILNSGFSDEEFDCAAIVGGLHHLHPNVEAAISEIHRILKPGGYFCFTEPHGGSIPDIARKFWYSKDTLFEENERAINLKQLESTFSDRFTFKHKQFQGNIAYLLVFNSMVLRVPLRFKEVYSPLCFILERLIQKLQGKTLSCFAVVQWQKTDNIGQITT